MCTSRFLKALLLLALRPESPAHGAAHRSIPICILRPPWSHSSSTFLNPKQRPQGRISKDSNSSTVKYISYQGGRKGRNVGLWNFLFHFYILCLFAALTPGPLLNVCKGWDLISTKAVMTPILHVSLTLIAKFSDVAVRIWTGFLWHFQTESTVLCLPSQTLPHLPSSEHQFLFCFMAQIFY